MWVSLPRYINCSTIELNHTILVTNAAGGLNPEYAVGDLVLLNDVCFTFLNGIYFVLILILLLISISSLPVWQAHIHYAAQMRRSSVLGFSLCQMPMTSNFVVTCIKRGKPLYHRKANGDCMRGSMRSLEVQGVWKDHINSSAVWMSLTSKAVMRLELSAVCFVNSEQT